MSVLDKELQICKMEYYVANSYSFYKLNHTFCHVTFHDLENTMLHINMFNL